MGLALTRHRRSLIVRREAINTKALVDDLRECLGDVGSFNGQTLRWSGIPGERVIEFGGVKNPGDEQRYRGRPHDLLCVDEADQVPERVVRFLMGWVRTTVIGQHCQVVLCFNPPSTAEGEWLLSFFGPWVDDKHPNPARPEEVRWYAMVDNVETERPDGSPFVHKGETIQPKSRTFIPAKLTDNPALMATGYGAQLQAMPEPLRSQLLYGNFSIGRLDDAWQCIPTAWVKAAMDRWRASPQPPAGLALTRLGVDVAYGGADSTCISPRWGNWFGHVKKYQGQVTDSGSKAAALVLAEHDGSAPVHIDVIGYGSSCYEALKAKIGKLAIPVNVAKAWDWDVFDRSRRYKLVNTRAIMWWKMREALDPEHGDGPGKPSTLCLPPDPELLSDLTAPRYEARTSGIVIEDKQSIKERIGRSPDKGDATCLCNLPDGKIKLTAGMIGVPH